MGKRKSKGKKKRDKDSSHGLVRPPSPSGAPVPVMSTTTAPTPETTPVLATGATATPCRQSPEPNLQYYAAAPSSQQPPLQQIPQVPQVPMVHQLAPAYWGSEGGTRQVAPPALSYQGTDGHIGLMPSTSADRQISMMPPSGVPQMPMTMTPRYLSTSSASMAADGQAVDGHLNQMQGDPGQPLLVTMPGQSYFAPGSMMQMQHQGELQPQAQGVWTQPQAEAVPRVLVPHGPAPPPMEGLWTQPPAEAVPRVLVPHGPAPPPNPMEAPMLPQLMRAGEDLVPPPQEPPRLVHTMMGREQPDAAQLSVAPRAPPPMLSPKLSWNIMMSLQQQQAPPTAAPRESTG